MMLRRRRGQSVAEFALVVTILVAVLTTAIDFIPLFNLRAQVFEIAAGTVESAAVYKAPIGATEAQQRNWLCEQLKHQVYDLMRGAGLDVGTTKPNATCDPTDFSTLGTGRRFTVSAELLAAFDAKPGTLPPVDQRKWDVDPRSNGQGGAPAPRYARICVGYQWVSSIGILALYNQGIAGINPDWISQVKFGFCGRAVLDPRRSR